MMQAPGELVIASHSHPNVIFEDKAGAYQRAATFISSVYAAIQMYKLNQVRFITFGAFNFGAIIIIL
jgi:metallophosphoesterase superfamily enzyme